MHPNEILITRFYTCFQNLDFRGMQACYADDARFTDPAFGDLDAAEVRAMWEMLIRNARDLVIEFGQVRADDRQGSADWTARYTFSATGKKVVNRIHAAFVFADGRIVRHTDTFDYYRWARQALGLPGWLFGWTPWLRDKVRERARKNLDRFMTRDVSARA
jgi:ketosteroid isomerase-like protein